MTEEQRAALRALAATHASDAERFAPGMPGRDYRQETAGGILSLLDALAAAETDGLVEVLRHAAAAESAEAERDKAIAERAALRADLDRARADAQAMRKVLVDALKDARADYQWPHPAETHLAPDWVQEAREALAAAAQEGTSNAE